MTGSSRNGDEVGVGMAVCEVVGESIREASCRGSTASNAIGEGGEVVAI